jgi:hypothetical protein
MILAAKMTVRIVTFSNAAYIPVTANWLSGLVKLGLDHMVTIVSLDDATRDAFPPHRVLHRPHRADPMDLAALWSHRLRVLRELLLDGHAVIHSDTDAIWLRNPLPDIEACNSPLVFTQGTFWPRDVHERRGIVLCCGLFYLGCEPEVLQFLDSFFIRMEEDKDDQMAINRVVDTYFEPWQIVEPYEVPFRDTHFVASRTPMRTSSSDGSGFHLSVSLLPHHAFPRLVDAISDEIVVAHPLSGKTLKEKESCLAELGLWETGAPCG